MNFDTNKIQALKPFLYIGAGVAGYFLVLKPLFEKLGVTKGADDKAIEAAEKLPGWNIKFWEQAVSKGLVTKKALSDSGMNKIAVPINTALDKSFWQDDDEETVLSEIRKVRTMSELSFLSAIFQGVYKKNLFERLKAKFSAGEMVNVIRYVKDLPLYKPKTITGFPSVW